MTQIRVRRLYRDAVLLIFPLLAACSHPGEPEARPDLRADTAIEHVPGDTAPTWTPCTGAPAVWLNEIVSANLHGISDDAGDQPDWIELALVDPTSGPVDVRGWTLGTDLESGWPLPESLSETPLLYASGDSTLPDHTDFTLDPDGDEIFLTMPTADGTCVVDHVVVPRLYNDIAYGRSATDPNAWEYFVEPTPGAPNTTESRPGFADPPVLTPAAGFYATPVQFSATGAGRITYTLDGSVPTSAGASSSTPVDIDATAQPVVVRARAFVDGLWPSRPATATYSEDPTILDGGVMIISLTVDPPDLWDEATGIYVSGTNAEPDYPYFGANFWQEWEKDAHVEIFGATGTQVIDQDAGIQIAGGYSRAFDQRNFEILARSGYGPDTFGAPVFANEDLTEYRHLYLRNGGDWCSTQIVDGSVQAVFRGDDQRHGPAVDIQAYRPVLVYLNGEFWGVYELKERLDEYWISAHRDEGPEDLDRVKIGWTHEANWTLDQGTWDAFDALNSLATQDLSEADAWAQFEATVDLQNLATAVVVQGWIGNTDWWGNNIRMWRPHRDDGKWRWMVYDFGHGWPSPRYDHLATSIAGNWDGLPIAAALANPSFRDLFINAHADYLNTSLAPERARATVTALADEVRPVMPMQRERWCSGASMETWESEVTYAERFAAQRPGSIDAQLIDHFGLSGHASLTLEADPPDAGTFTLAVLSVSPPFTGEYYANVPVTVTAAPADGYAFSGWSDSALGASPTVTLPMAESTSATALFTPI